MRYGLLLLSVLTVPAMAAAEGEVMLQGDKAPLNITPTFNHGYLATYEMNAIAVYRPNGSLAMRIARPDNTGLGAPDMDTDGSVAVPVSRGWLHSSVAIFSADGSAAGEITTGRYRPSQVCFAPDHSIWVLGRENPENEPGNYSLLRHYSRTGELLGEFFPRASFPRDAFPGMHQAGLWGLRIAGGRMGMILRWSGPDKSTLWLEMDLEGKETGRWITPRGGVPVAMTASGKVYAQTENEILVLDRASGSWKPIQSSSNDRLLGADGDTLIFSIHGMNAIRHAAQP
jgi:hypothetical protein